MSDNDDIPIRPAWGVDEYGQVFRSAQPPIKRLPPGTIQEETDRFDAEVIALRAAVDGMFQTPPTAVRNGSQREDL